MVFMKPVVFVANAYVVETEMGTETVLEEVAGPGASHYSLAKFLEGSNISSVELKKNQVLGHLSASGYMDQTDVERFDSIQEAWNSLVDQYPEAFEFQVEFTADQESGEMPTAHRHASCIEEALALRLAVQSVDGGHMELDGTFLYAPIADPQVAKDELEASGFTVIEDA